MAEREGLCANYLPYPNLQAFRARSDAAGTNAGTMDGTSAKRKPPPRSDPDQRRLGPRTRLSSPATQPRGGPLPDRWQTPAARAGDAGHAAGTTAVGRLAVILMN